MDSALRSTLVAVVAGVESERKAGKPKEVPGRRTVSVKCGLRLLSPVVNSAVDRRSQSANFTASGQMKLEGLISLEIKNRGKDVPDAEGSGDFTKEKEISTLF